MASPGQMSHFLIRVVVVDIDSSEKPTENRGEYGSLHPLSSFNQLKKLVKIITVSVWKFEQSDTFDYFLPIQIFGELLLEILSTGKRIRHLVFKVIRGLPLNSGSRSDMSLKWLHNLIRFWLRNSYTHKLRGYCQPTGNTRFSLQAVLELAIIPLFIFSQQRYQ